MLPKWKYLITLKEWHLVSPVFQKSQRASHIFLNTKGNEVCGWMPIIFNDGRKHSENIFNQMMVLDYYFITDFGHFRPQCHLGSQPLFRHPGLVK